jgi:hypothetical protein
MSRNGSEEAAPTMIIPRGTKIEIDPHGQLSVQAPGNLVIQNSGAYGTIESLGGSIRIDRNVEVEAVSVRCADACYVQGSLTAWKVSARTLQVEDTAQAQIVLQETERLEIGREARVVGNFESEKELFLLFSRFARQVRSLPFYFERKAPPELPGGGARGDEEDDEKPREAPRDRPRPVESWQAEPQEAAAAAEEEEGGEPPRPRQDLPEPLFFALVLLERDAGRGGYGPTSQRVLEELIKLLQERDVETLRHTYRTLFGRILEPRDDVRRAHELIASFYGTGESRTDPQEPADDEEETAAG